MVPKADSGAFLLLFLLVLTVTEPLRPGARAGPGWAGPGWAGAPGLLGCCKPGPSAHDARAWNLVLAPGAALRRSWGCTPACRVWGRCNGSPRSCCNAGVGSPPHIHTVSRKASQPSAPSFSLSPGDVAPPKSPSQGCSGREFARLGAWGSRRLRGDSVCLQRFRNLGICSSSCKGRVVFCFL